MTDECVLMAFRYNQYASESTELEHKRGGTWERWAEWMHEDLVKNITINNENKLIRKMINKTIKDSVYHLHYF